MDEKTSTGIRAYFDRMTDRCAEANGSITLFWSAKGVGFGQYFIYTGEDERIHIDSECMSRESVKKILNIMVDQAIFDDEVRHEARNK